MFTGECGNQMAANYTKVSESAKRCLQKSQYDKAIKLWEDFLQNANENDAANALNNLGDICSKSKRTVEAIDHYLKASHAFEKAGFPLKAIATLKKIVKMDPNRVEVHLRLGDLNARRDMVGNAVEAYLNVVKLMVRQGERDEALSMITKICILDPVNTRHRLQLAAELFELGFTEQAVGETIAAIDLFLQKGNLEEAERYCRHLLDVSPGNPSAKERLEAIARWGQPDAASSGGMGGGGEASIDDIFAELDLAMADPSAASATEPATDAPAAAVDDEASFGDLDFSPDTPAEEAPPEAPGLDMSGLLESTSQEEAEAPAPDDGMSVALESTSLDSGSEDEEFGTISLSGDAESEAAPEGIDLTADSGDGLEISLDGGDLAGEEPSVQEESLTEEPAPAAGTDPAGEDLFSVTSYAVETAPDAGAPQEAGGDGGDVNEMLSEASFYEAQGMADEARTLYEKILSQDPGNTTAAERLKELDSGGSASEPEFSISIDPEPAPEPESAPEPQPAEPEFAVSMDSVPEPAATANDLGDEFSDLTSEVLGTLGGEDDGSWKKVGEDAKLDEIVSAFRKGIQAEVSDDDAETHYDLGVAYREMGLLEEAIGEFQLSVKGATRFADSCVMLAQCFSELGKVNLAISQLKKAVNSPNCDPEALIALTYELACALEAAGQNDEAKQRYEEVYAHDINFRNVSEKLASLN